MGRVLIILVSIVMLLSACQAVPVEASETGTPAPSPLGATITTVQPTLAQTEKPEPTMKPTATPTRTKKPYPTLEPMITPTPDPNLIPIDDMTEQYNPVVFQAYYNVIFGGSRSRDGKWFECSDFAGTLNGEVANVPYHYNSERADLTFALARVGQHFKFYTPSGLYWEGDCTGLYHHTDGCGNEYYQATFDAIPEACDMLIGVSCSWNPQPRLPKHYNKGNTYVIDLDGDGIYEKIIIKALPDQEEDGWTPHQVSLVQGHVTTPFTRVWIDDCYSNSYAIHFLDLNGDGTMEIIIQSSGHDHSITIYELRQNTMAPVLGYWIGN